MSTIIPNDFTSYALTDEETIQGTILTITQKQVIQNQIAVAAMTKVALEPDADSYTEFLQQEAHLRGTIDALKYLIDLSDASEELVRTKAGIRTQPEV